jgi:hypothetical protein
LALDAEAMTLLQGTGVFLVVAGVALLVLGLLTKREHDDRPSVMKALGGQISVPAGVALALVGVLAVAAPNIPAILGNEPPSHTPSSASSPSVPATTPPGNVSIKSPQNGQIVVGPTGVTISGTVTAVHGDLWIFVIAGGELSDTEYYRMDNDPLIVSNGQWSFEAKPIGASSDPPGQQFPIIVVQATADCSSAIRRQPPNGDGDVVFLSLPPGCTEAGRRTVVRSG